MESSLLALEAGAPALCEKPFAVNLAQAERMISKAKEKKVYIAEGMWTRHNPVLKKVLEWISEGRIGEVRSFTADFAFNEPFDPSRRVHDYERAGGALPDLGVYNVAVSQFIFGEKPEKISAMARFEGNGGDNNKIDTMCAALLGYKNGGIARLFAGTAVSAENGAAVYGEKGEIHIPSVAIPSEARMSAGGGETVYAPGVYYGDEFFKYEFDAVMDDIREGRLENGFVTHKHTLEVMRILDEIRAKIGLRYREDQV
jgi:predicted dehydrogenase